MNTHDIQDAVNNVNKWNSLVVANKRSMKFFLQMVYEIENQMEWPVAIQSEIAAKKYIAYGNITMAILWGTRQMDENGREREREKVYKIWHKSQFRWILYTVLHTYRKRF